MGAAGSVVSLDQLSAETIGDMVGKLGAAYEPYKNSLVSNGISGEVISAMSDAEMTSLFQDLEIKSPLHQKVLLTHFKKLKGGGGGGGGGNKSSAGNDADCCQYHPLPADFTVGEKVTRTPRSIMSTLFEIQGIPVDPTDLDPAVDKIAKAVGTGFGDGKEKYDCFINYRVASDADLAEKLYLYLKTKGIHAFLDKKCLKNGEKWKDGFLTGLKNSKCFVAVISRRALDRVRDESDNHTWDNVLLEYETALAIKETTKNAKYICPLHVGQCEKGVLTKFIDFGASLYPDSIEAIKKDPSTAPPAEPPKARVAAAPKPPLPSHSNDDGEAEVEEKEEEAEAAEETATSAGEVCCGVCDEPVIRQRNLLPPGTTWSCDFPGHEGDNSFTDEDPIYGCPTCLECNYGVCRACYMSIKDSTAAIDAEDEDENVLRVDQPEGTRSKYNDDYYCDIRRVTFQSAEDEGLLMIISFNIRGDGSLGPLQDPSTSRVIVGGREVHAKEVKIFIDDYFQKQGDLYFEIPNSMQEPFTSEKVVFVFGSSGYSEATIAIPGSDYHHCDFPKCTNGHTMTVSEFAEDGYESGFICNFCREAKPISFRWFCKSCQDDYCFNCRPCQVMNPSCQNDHTMERRTTKPAGYSGVYCDNCGRGGLQHDCEFYHCKDGCNYDLCLPCASEQVAATASD